MQIDALRRRSARSRWKHGVVFFAGMLAVSLALIAKTAVNLNVEVQATVTPKPCTYPEVCGPVSPGTATSATITEGQVQYIGPPPSVSTEGDLLVVMF